MYHPFPYFNLSVSRTPSVFYGRASVFLTESGCRSHIADTGAWRRWNVHVPSGDGGRGWDSQGQRSRKGLCLRLLGGVTENHAAARGHRRTLRGAFPGERVTPAPALSEELADGCRRARGAIGMPAALHPAAGCGPGGPRRRRGLGNQMCCNTASTRSSEGQGTAHLC